MENILSWLIWIPLIGVGIIAFIPRDKTNLIKLLLHQQRVFNFY